MRLIDADALIEDVKTLWDYETVDGITSSTVLKQIVTDIQNAPTISAPRWVRCEDELPKYTGRYIVWCGVNWNGEGMHGETMIARYHRDRKSWYVEADDSFRGPLIGDTLYWMPIEPPQEES